MKTRLSFLQTSLLACILIPWQALQAQPVNTNNSTPLITIFNPTNQARFIAPADLGVGVKLNDPDQRVYLVGFFANTNLIGTRRVPFRPRPPFRADQFGVPWSFVPSGEYTLTAVAREASGEALGTSAPVRITVEFSCEVGVVILPQVSGPVAFFPEFGLFVDQSGISDLQALYFKTTDMNREFRRGFAEFAIPALPVQFSSAALVLTGTSQGVDVLELSYYAGDLAIGTNDFDQPTVSWATFQPPQTSPTESAQTVLIDVTSLVAQFKGANLGFRIKLPDDPAFDQFDSHGAGFRSPRLVLNTCSDPPPRVGVWARDPIASEGSRAHDQASFVVWRTGATNSALAVHYSVKGSATKGVDYEAFPATVTIPAGQRFVQVPVKPLDDTLVERTESVVLELELTPPVLDPAARLSLPPPYLLSHQRAVVFIFDNDRWRRHGRGR